MSKSQLTTDNGETSKKLAVFLGRGVYDFMENSLVEGLLLNGFTVLGRHPANSIPEVATIAELSDVLRSPKVLLFYNKENTRIARQLGGHETCRIFIDGRDDPYINLTGLLTAKLYLKRELLKSWPARLATVDSFPFGIESRYPPTKGLDQKNIDIYAGFNLETHRSRKIYEKALDKFRKENTNLKIVIKNTGERAYNNKTGNALPTPEYHNLLQSSKFVISPRGAGQDCARLWEAISAGAVVISEEISIHYPLKKDVHYISFNSVQDLEQKLSRLQGNPGEIYESIRNNINQVVHEQSTKHKVEETLKKISSDRFLATKVLSLVFALLYNALAYFYLLHQRHFRHKSIRGPFYKTIFTD